MEYRQIRNSADAEVFLKRYRGLHDGIVVSVNYRADVRTAGMKTERNWQGNELTLGILARSVEGAPTVELVFRGVVDWHLSRGGGLYGIIMEFTPNGGVTWADSHTTDWDVMKEATFVCAASAAWRELSAESTAVQR